MSWWDSLHSQSFAGSYNDAGSQLAALQAKKNNPNYAWTEKDERRFAALTSQQGQAVAGGILSGLSGATTLLTNAFQSAQTRDTSVQEGQIADLRQAGNYNYQNYDQLANDYASTDFNPSFNYQDIRGMTTGQQIGAVGTSTLSGAMTGLQIGGPWGALVGGVVGLGTGLGGVLAGNAAADRKKEELEMQADLASGSSRLNFAAAHERIGDNMHRQQAVNAVARGGRIQTIQEYAAKVLGPGPQQRAFRPSSKIQKVYCDGGLKIKIKK